MSGTDGRNQAAQRRARRAVGVGLLLLAVAAPGAQASMTIGAQGETYTGASFFVIVDPSDPDAVVLVEWDFDGDGQSDVNRTDGLEAGFTYGVPGDYEGVVTVTRRVGDALESETKVFEVQVHNGTPTVSIVVPERAVAGVPQEFLALASDKDPSPGGEAFTFEWAVDGVAVPSAGASADVLVDQPGTHVVTLQVTDEEGVRAQATVTVSFGSPGLFDGRQGVINLGLLLAAFAFGVGLALMRAAQRERRASALREDEAVALASEEAVGVRGKPEKVPFQAAAETSVQGSGGARVVHGGAPAALARTKECPVCHSAIDADLDSADCPYCLANAEAEALESTLSGPAFEAIDLSEVRALLQRARRERHLGRTDQHSALVKQARERADELLEERASAQVWLEKARKAAEAASPKIDPERLDRAHSYLKLAESLSKAHQHGKVQRHAQRSVEILSEGVGGGREMPDRCHACGGAIAAARAAGAQQCPHCDVALRPQRPEESEGESPQALEAEVRSELGAVRDLLSAGKAAPDEEAWSLLKEAEAFEQDAAWSQALELLRTLRERFERERDAAGPDEGTPDEPAAGPTNGT